METPHPIPVDATAPMQRDAQPAQHPEAIDTRWYSTFESLGAFQAYEYLDGDKTERKTQRTLFESGEIEQPILDYPLIDPNKLNAWEEGLLSLKRDIMEQEQNETVQMAYRRKINEKIAEVRMLRATLRGDLRRFRRYCEFIYGRPSRDVFSYTIRQLRIDATSAESSEGDSISSAARDLLEVLPDVTAVDSHIEFPDSDIIDSTRSVLMPATDLLIGAESLPNAQFASTEIQLTFQNVLNSLQAEGWSVIIVESSKTGISVDHETKQVKIPSVRSLSAVKLRSLIAHELGTHVQRRLNGERSKLMLLGLGLDRYERGEEGIATLKEQVIDPSVKDFSGLEGHLAISLAYGLDGTPRNFREVYDILKKHFYLKELRSGKNPEKAEKSAQTSAWSRCVRTFRGTNCSERGVCFTKDLIYREGNIGVWDVVRSNPDEMMRFQVGKYDPSNPDHIYILGQLGITDADLEELEEVN